MSHVDAANSATHAINAANARASRGPEAAANAIFAVVLGVLAVAALLHYLEPCADAALCVAAAITRHPRHLWRRLSLSLQRWLLQCRLRAAQKDVAWTEHDLAHLPQQLQRYRAFVAELRVKLIDCNQALQQL